MGFEFGHPSCCTCFGFETAKSNSAPPRNRGEGGGQSDVSSFIPGTPMSPRVTGLEAVIPPTWVDFPLGPSAVMKFDRISVFASQDIILLFRPSMAFLQS